MEFIHSVKDASDLKQQYHKAAKKCHPDIRGGSHEKMQRLNAEAVYWSKVLAQKQDRGNLSIVTSGPEDDGRFYDAAIGSDRLDIDELIAKYLNDVFENHPKVVVRVGCAIWFVLFLVSLALLAYVISIIASTGRIPSLMGI